MKQTFLLTLIALAITFNLHAAAGPKAETGLDKDMLNLIDKAEKAIIADDIPVFASLFEQNPKLIDFKFGGDNFTILSLAIMYEKPAYLYFLIRITQEIEPYDLEHLLEYASSSTCPIHCDHTFHSRLVMLKTVFDCIKTKPLAPNAITETVKTPQQWLQCKAQDFLKSKACSTCRKPQGDHPALYQHRMAEFRKALQLN